MCSFAASVRLEPRPIFRGGGEKNKGIYYQTERMQLLSVYSSVSVSLSVLLSYWGVQLYCKDYTEKL